ncbi:hypothetical protein SteCoe_13785 [Stentor coeruleus]|uniref:Uncharacterized protein n=1 Tax=Stentor coeruleus TaxID=5963 RepID=A0A1R2C7M2_9CILI|nr:hypothetical protein SteCoe_13785 [Stentor coeruleus]
MQEVYVKLSEDERKILQSYHQRNQKHLTNQPNLKPKAQETSELFSNSKVNFRNEAPLKVLTTKIFNNSQEIIPQKPKVIISYKPRSSSTSKYKSTPRNSNVDKNSSKSCFCCSKASNKEKSNSRNGSAKKIVKKKKIYKENDDRTFEIMRLENWKGEIDKLLKVVFKHSVLCTHFREEAARIGGLRMLDEFRKYNN